MENTEKKNTGFIVLVIVLILMVIGLTSYIVYDRVLSKKDDSTDKIQESSEQNSHVNDENYDDGKALFEKFIAFDDCFHGKMVYSFKNLNYNNLDNEKKLVMAMLNSNDIVYNKNFSANSSNITSDGGIILDYYSKIKISDLEKSYRDLFGPDKTPDLSITFKDNNIESGNEFYDEFSISYWDSDDSVGCKKENNEFVCYMYMSGCIDPANDYYRYDYSEIGDGKLYIYVNHLYTIQHDSNYRLYSDAAEENLIDNISEEDSKNPDKLFEKYKGKTGVYKLVFAKDTSDNWYWEGTQIVKK